MTYRVSEQTVMLEGHKELVAKLMTYGERVFRKHARRAMTKAGRIVAKAQKGAAPRESGLLGLSVGSKVITVERWNTVIVINGPRKGFRRAVSRTARGTLKHHKSAGDTEGAAAGYRDPVKYAHLVELGRKAVTTKKRSLVDSWTGKFLGKRVRATAGRHFMRNSFNASRGEAMSVIQREMAIGVEQEAVKRA